MRKPVKWSSVMKDEHGKPMIDFCGEFWTAEDALVLAAEIIKALQQGPPKSSPSPLVDPPFGK